MPTYVYAAIYDRSGHVLISTKNQRGLFFHDPANPGNGFVLAPPGQVLNGAGLDGIPGGSPPGVVNDIATAWNGALAEFFEETGWDLQTHGCERRLAPYHAVDGHNDFWGVYILTDHEIEDVRDGCNANLVQGQLAATAVLGGQFVNNYVGLLNHFQGCPPDNELHSMRVLDLNNAGDWATIQSWNGTAAQGWFYDIFNNLRGIYPN